jgi:acyl-CoA dehydrogenase
MLSLIRKLAPDRHAVLDDWRVKAKEFADHHLRPRALEIDKRCKADPTYIDWDLLKAAAPYGFLSTLVPKGMGGAGEGCTALALVMEELCVACPGIANIFGAHGLGVSAILLGFDVYHYDRVLKEMAEAERKGAPIIFAAAITEPLAGSDVEDAEFLRTARLITEATPVPGGYRLNGRKVFISNGSVAEITAVVAPTDKRRPVETQSAFVVRKGTPGFSVGRVEEKMGMKACPAAELIFEDCFIPKENIIGQEGQGVRLTELVLGGSRAPVGAVATGIARGALERTIEFAKNKKLGGKRLLDQQWVQIKLAEMGRKIQLARQAYLVSALTFDLFGAPKLMQNPAARLLLDVMPAPLRTNAMANGVIRSDTTQSMMASVLDRLLDEKDARRIQRHASMAKVSGGDTAVEVTYEALQIVGLEGSLQRYELEKLYRDAKLTQIYEGTNQLNRHNIYSNGFLEEGMGHQG